MVHTTQHFDLAGSPGRPAIVLIHGSVVTRKMWIPQLEALAPHHTVIALDLPGHGSRAEESFSLDAASNAIIAAMDAAGVEKAFIVGLSLGGYVAIDFARRHPNRATGLVVASATMNPVGLLGFWFRVSGRLIKAMGTSRMERSATRSLRRKIRPALAEPIIAAGLFPRGAAESFTAIAGKDFVAMLRDLDVPIMFMNGRFDQASNRGLRAFLKAAEETYRVVLEDAGHMANLDQPLAFTSAVRAFIARSESRSEPQPRRDSSKTNLLQIKPGMA